MAGAPIPAANSNEPSRPSREGFLLPTGEGAAIARQQRRNLENSRTASSISVMRNLRSLRGVVAIWAVIVAGVVVARGTGGNGAPLPAYQQYPGLPPQFDQALQTVRAVAGGGGVESIRALAHLYQANRLFREARTCFEAIRASAGGLNARDYYLLADIARNDSDLGAAQHDLRESLRLDPEYLPARLALAEALFKSGDEAGAEKEYLAIIASDPGQPQANLALARIALQRGDDEAASARLEDLVANHPTFTEGAAVFAKILERRGETDRAIAMTQLSQQKPEPPPPDPWLESLLADCYDVQRLSITFEEYFKLGRMKEAVPVLDRLSELNPDGPITKMFAGFSHAKALEHITAIREYYDALQKGGDAEKICPLLVQSLLAIGRLDEAAGLMADYRAKMPASLPIAKAYAEVALRRNDDKLARSLLDEVLQKQPYLQAENMSLAKILWTAGERDEAAKCLRRVATVYANDVGSRALLGEYYLGKSDPVAAIKPLEEAMPYATPKTPAEAGLRNLLAAAYLQAANAEAERGNWADAANHYEKLSRLAPADLQSYAGWANACVQLKQFGRAAQALEKMVSIDPENPTFHLTLGDVLYQDGKAERARRSWTKAKELVAAGDRELVAALDRRLNGPITDDLFR